MSRIDCPNVGNWQALLEGERSDCEMEGLARHLESCGTCQQTLESLAVAPASWEDTARAWAEQRPKAYQEPALQDMMQRLKSEKPPTPEADLSFLQPADDPNLLGLLDSYQVQEVIGRGGMGVVLKAFDPVLHRLVAIKVLDPALAGNGTARRRFTRESQAAAAVCHDHVVAVHGVGEANGFPYLVMQYVAGESLQARLDHQGPLETVEVVRIGLQTASGLAVAHAQGLIHRDIKPANLLLENSLIRVKITDFGLARMSDDVGLTQNGVVAGTPEYMAPEQARAEVVDHRADLFSLGSVLYACCTGSPPFRGSTALAVLSQVSDKEPAPIRSLNAAVPAWLEAFIARLMAKDPAQRFQSAAEVAALLEGYLAHLRQPATVSAPELPISLADANPRPLPHGAVKRFLHRRSLPVLGLSILLGLGIAFWLAADNGGTDPKTGQDRKAGAERPQVVTDAVGSARTSGPKKWLIALVLCVGILLSFGALAGWLIVRRSRRAAKEGDGAAVADPKEASLAAAPVLSFPCSGCGKRLKAKPELSGKKIKCPQCGVLVRVSQSEPTSSKGAKFPAWILWLAASLGLVLILLVVWICWPSKSPPPSFLDVTLGNRFVEGVEESGFSHDEENELGPFRWTDGRGRLVIPLDKRQPPQALFVQIQRPRNSWLQLMVNDREMVNEPANERDMTVWEKTLDLSGLDLGEKLVVEIVSNTLVPHEMTPTKSEDTRPLGVTVRAVKLLRQAANEETVTVGKSFLEVPLGHRFVEGVEDSGFHNDERDDKGWFRWTNGKGRLVIPLDKTAPRPQTLWARLRVPRGISLRIAVNQRTLVGEPANKQQPREWERMFDLSGIDLGEKLVVEIVSGARRSGDHPEDSRMLGVQVRGIKLLREINGEKVSADKLTEPRP